MRASTIVFQLFFQCLTAYSLPDLSNNQLLEIPGTTIEATNLESKKDKYEIVHLSRHLHPVYNFNAFGRDIKLYLKPNEKIVSDVFKTYLVHKGGREEVTENTKPCYYLHADNVSTAAVNFCHENKLHGLLFFERYVLEITPVNKPFSGNFNTTVPHVVKKSLIKDIPWEDELASLPSVLGRQADHSLNSAIKMNSKQREKRPVLEAALFFDEAAFRIFSPYFNHDVVELRDMLLAYINGVQALYHHPSIGRKVDIMLTQLEIFRNQPHDLPHFRGDRELLLDSFCNYHTNQNPPGDENPQHWDIGLYVSGLDFFAVEKGKKSGVTMGLAVVGGVCLEQYSCIIAEFGVTNILGKPYPSAGFTSVFIMAHEIGHSLGMHHDGYTNDCPKEGYIMSPSRGVFGETLWSSCSAQVIDSLSSWATCLYDEANMNEELDHRKFGDTPGLVWNIKKQCELLLKDKDADVYITGNEEDVCQNVQCRTPHRAGFYYSGPAVEGSLCGNNKWCKGGECIHISDQRPNDITIGHWSKWTIQQCKSACIVNSKGHQTRRRICNSPSPVNTNEGCEGSHYEVLLCDDKQICQEETREKSTNYASRKCKQFSNFINEIDKEGVGLQAPHESERPWMGCTVFCRRSDGSSFYTPRIELNDLGVDPYFPDGTWCHYNGNQNYYCIQHHCLPEDFHYNKNLHWDADLQLAQNARPENLPLSTAIKQYLSVDNLGRPLMKLFNMNSTYWDDKNDAWETKDYLEIP